jgi:hypothetical protein
MDGSIIREAFEEAYLKDNQPVYIGEGQEEYSKRETSYSDEDNAIIEERLRGLGYIE